MSINILLLFFCILLSVYSIPIIYSCEEFTSNGFAIYDSETLNVTWNYQPSESIQLSLYSPETQEVFYLAQQDSGQGQFCRMKIGTQDVIKYNPFDLSGFFFSSNFLYYDTKDDDIKAYHWFPQESKPRMGLYSIDYTNGNFASLKNYTFPFDAYGPSNSGNIVFSTFNSLAFAATTQSSDGSKTYCAVSLFKFDDPEFFKYSVITLSGSSQFIIPIQIDENTVVGLNLTVPDHPEEAYRNNLMTHRFDTNVTTNLGTAVGLGLPQLGSAYIDGNNYVTFGNHNLWMWDMTTGEFSQKGAPSSGWYYLWDSWAFPVGAKQFE